MLKKIFFNIIFWSLLSVFSISYAKCCTEYCTYYKNSRQPIDNTNYSNLPYFNKLLVGSNIDVLLTNGQPGIAVEPYNTKCTKFSYTFDKFNVLHLDSTACDHTRILVTLRVPNLNYLEVNGLGRVVSKYKNFKAHDLAIRANQSGAVHLEGKLNCNKIIQNGTGVIELMWINSNNLRVDAYHSGPIHLAGLVRDLFVTARDSASLDGKYLRTDTATILATNKAVVDITVKNKLKAYADTSSLVTYHKLDKPVIVSKNSGNVLYLDPVR